MGFESIPHYSRPVASPEEAANLIKSGQVGQDALIWELPEGRFAALRSGGLNNPWLEVAVVNLDTGEQVESITAGWVDSVERLGQHFRDAANETVWSRPANFCLDNFGLDNIAVFECSSCGRHFRSTLRFQRDFDQDEGMGICPKCDR